MTEADREAVERAQRLEALGEIVGRFAHDFSNLLATIVLNLGLIEKRCSDPTALWFAGNALRAADRGANLANRLRAFGGKQKLSRAPTELDLLVPAMRDLLARAAGPTVELLLHGTAGLWPVSIDRDQVEFALMNVVENARDAMPRGGELRIEMANIQVAHPMPGLAAGDYVVLALEDTGEGLSEEAIERAFEPFFSTRHSREHPGLGLSAVLGIARAHGGDARVRRAVGGGCRVEIYLPRATEAEMRAVGEPEAVSPQAAQPLKATVLVVDDDPDLRAVAEEGLTCLGCDVLLADSGFAALEILAAHPPVDLLVVDMSMTGMNGLELIRRAREMRPGLNALITTGGEEPPTWRGGGHRPLTLRKPFRVADLAHAIAAAMSGEVAK